MKQNFTAGDIPALVLRPRILLVVAALAVCVAPSMRGQATVPQALAGASLEDLMKIDVTSVSKKEQTLARTGAAVFVIGREDIRRSGATNIPDLLRMVPGVEVAQLNANQWSVTIRGFNAVNSDKVLVLIDGRTAYVDIVSSVYWDKIDVPLEDIERIEVIRGPGGTVWGANAVNGVINIITRSAADTKGALVVAGAGSQSAAQGLVQYGSDAGSTGAYRIFGKYFDTFESPLPGGHSAADAWHTSHVGFRSDWGPSPRDTLSFQGDFIAGTGGEPAGTVAGYQATRTSENYRLSDYSGDFLAKWEHTLVNGSHASLQVYDSAFQRGEEGVKISDNTLDAEFEYHFSAGSRQDVVWGLDYRFSRDSVQPVSETGTQINVPVQSVNLFAGFIQDEIRIANSLFLTLGVKLEHNAYTGFEYEPGAQLVWTMTGRQSLWASAARAIREPDPVERLVNYTAGFVPLPGEGSAALIVLGNPDELAEQMTAWEVGYRTQINPRLSLDATTFLNFYRRLVTNEPGAPFVTYSDNGPLLAIPINYANLARASDYGFEFFAGWQVSGRWKLSPGYSSLRMFVERDPGSNDISVADTSGDSPKQQFELRSALNVRKNLEWDASLKYSAALNGLAIPAYTRLDTRLAWHIGESMELSLVGQNLASPRHFEFLDDSGIFGPAEVARSIFAKATWRSR